MDSISVSDRRSIEVDQNKRGNITITEYIKAKQRQSFTIPPHIIPTLVEALNAELKRGFKKCCGPRISGHTCGQPSLEDGLCEEHLTQLRNGEVLKPLTTRTALKKFCVGPTNEAGVECGRRTWAGRDYCEVHARQLKRTGDLKPITSVPVEYGPKAEALQRAVFEFLVKKSPASRQEINSHIFAVFQWEPEALVIESHLLKRLPAYQKTSRALHKLRRQGLIQGASEPGCWELTGSGYRQAIKEGLL